MINAEIVNLITKWFIIGPWVIWAIWELILLWMERTVPGVKTISMQTKDLGAGGLTSLIFAWFGLGSHYWINWTKPTWDFPWLGILFWVILAAYLATDLFTTWNHTLWPVWMQWVRYPPIVAGLAIFCGWFLFPQRTFWKL